MTLMALRFLVGAILLAVGFSEGVSGEFVFKDSKHVVDGDRGLSEWMFSGIDRDGGGKGRGRRM